jgi:hypothetical protein
MPSDWNLSVSGNPTGFIGPAGPGYQATSVTNLPIATGPITVNTQPGLAYTPGVRTRLSSNSNPTQWMEGVCTAYSGNSLTVNVDLTSSSISVVGMTVLPNYLGGLTLSNDATSPNTVLDIGTGGAAADDNSIMLMQSVSGFTKNCNAAWAVGSSLGALDSGTTLAANTWYHVFLIMRLDTNVVDVLISTSATAPVLPTNYTKKRRIGSIRTNASSQILTFTQVGDEFVWTWSRTTWEVNGLALPTTPALSAVLVPPGVKVRVTLACAFISVSGSYFATIQSPDMSTTFTAWNVGIANTIQQQDFQISAVTNTASQVTAYGNVAGPTLYYNTISWVDNRGK